jgi:hypothetical protein
MPSAAQYMQQMMQSLASAAAAALKQNNAINDVSLHSVDYAHFQGNLLYHASASDFDGDVKRTWSYDSASGRKQESVQMSRSDWESLWNGLVGSTFIQSYLVQDPSIDIDPFGFHVIGYSAQEGAIPTLGAIQVPARTPPPEFVQWLRHLNPPAALGL